MIQTINLNYVILCFQGLIVLNTIIICQSHMICDNSDFNNEPKQSEQNLRKSLSTSEPLTLPLVPILASPLTQSPPQLNIKSRQFLQGFNIQNSDSSLFLASSKDNNDEMTIVITETITSETVVIKTTYLRTDK